MSETRNLANVSHEICIKILSHLSPGDLFNLVQVNRSLNTLLTENLAVTISNEIWIEILSYLSPGNLFNVMQVNWSFNTLALTDPVWRKKFRMHFPDQYPKNPVSSSVVTLFREPYQAIYSAPDYKFSREQKKWFSLIKEGDLEGIKKLNVAFILRQLANNVGNILSWIKGNQALANYLFKAICSNRAKKNLGFKENDQTIGMSCLHWLAILGPSESLLQSLLPFSAHQDNFSVGGFTPLYFAAKYGQANACRWLLQHGASVNLGGNAEEGEASPLYIAAKYGHLDALKVLQEFGADIHATYRGYQPLYKAASGGHHQLVMFLLSCGAMPDATGRDGSTPLYVAAQNGHHLVVNALLEAGANPKHEYVSYDVLLIAAMHGHDSVVELLIDPRWGINIDKISNTSDPVGRVVATAALHIAAQNGHMTTVAKLLAAGAKTTITLQEGSFPAHIASQNGHLNVLKLLLPSLLGNINQTTTKGATCLYVASIKNQTDIIRFLLKYGADPTIRFEDGGTALHAAVAQGHLEAAEILVEHHPALLFCVNGKGETPLDVAKNAKESKQNIIDFLEAASAEAQPQLKPS